MAPPTKVCVVLVCFYRLGQQTDDVCGCWCASSAHKTPAADTAGNTWMKFKAQCRLERAFLSEPIDKQQSSQRHLQ